MPLFNCTLAGGAEMKLLEFFCNIVTTIYSIPMLVGILFIIWLLWRLRKEGKL
jgi:hypothetical protein